METTDARVGADFFRFKWPREAIFTLVVLAAAWEALSRLSPYLGIPPFAVPSFVRIGASLANVHVIDVVITFLRVMGALGISFVIGIAGAMFMYLSERADKHLQPFLRLVTAVPVVSWILFAILWFRWVEVRIAFVLIMVCAPIFLITILDSMRGVPRDLRGMMLSFRPTRSQLFLKLMVPATVPGVLTSWKINISLAIRVVTIAELVGAITGIGHMLAVAQELFSVADVFAWTLVLVVLLFILEAILEYIEKRLLRWRA
ncbi:ABC transporter permease subunit [Microbacteriaceae bacterium K1510]|nr:ABC transporter permease subunit [Microbacteriaceae bacterium K1510]